ncbi:MAG TPA: ABC transporter ATP-binding protein [Terriglobales bacterium]|jgi:ABC-2 type transport system ATP-binding protein|nr:ABC transporter ATP-binding protein [Terriglobales bacterium]
MSRTSIERPDPHAVAFHSVTKVFRNRPSLYNWIGRERGGETVALDSVSISARKGEVLVLLGPNGSGKTTFLKLISTMLLPDRGAVLVQGIDTREEPERARADVGFAVATERSFYPRLTARENLEFFASLENVPRSARARKIGEVLERTGLGDAADTLVMKFSSGMHQRLGISRALLKDPSILLLDEPTRSLDPGVACELWEWLRTTAREGRTIVVASHNFNEAVALGGRIAVLHRGILLRHEFLESESTAENVRAFYFNAVASHENCTTDLEDLSDVAVGG